MSRRSPRPPSSVFVHVLPVAPPADLAPCYLCRRAAIVRALFKPSLADSRRLGAPPRTLRCLAYTLCKKCMNKRGVHRKVEAKFFGSVHAACGEPAAN
jgi:hypothetical protein